MVDYVVDEKVGVCGASLKRDDEMCQKAWEKTSRQPSRWMCEQLQGRKAMWYPYWMVAITAQ